MKPPPLAKLCSHHGAQQEQLDIPAHEDHELEEGENCRDTNWCLKPTKRLTSIKSAGGK